MSVLSIDIGTTHVTIIEGQGKKGAGATIEKAVIAELPKESVIDGVIESKADVVDTIKKALKDGGFKSKNAVITVNVSNVTLRDFSLPNAKPQQLADMVKNEMVTSYQVGIDDSVQFMKLKPSVEEAEKGLVSIRAAAVKRKIVDSYHSLIVNLGLKPIAMDFHGNAINKLIGKSTSINSSNIEGKKILLIDFGSSGTVVHAIADENVFVSRYIPLGVSDLDQMICEKEFIEPDKAKHFRQNELDLLNENEDFAAYAQHARTFLMQWADELQKINRFFMARKGINAVDNIYVYGAGADIKGINEYINAAIGIETFTLQEISTVSFAGANKKLISHCINAAGAMIRL